jgi:predicted ribosome quality control (RQC) complex YloA/Tae2 family protein
MTPAIPSTFDSLVLAAVAQEMTRAAAGARISGVLQPDPYTLALRLGRRAQGILCSIHPRWARVVFAPLPEGRAVHPFALQVRARLADARLRAASAEPFERVLTLTCETLEGEVDLILEVMGRHSNLLLVANGRVAGAFKTVTPAMSRVRPVHAGTAYSHPPRSRPTPGEIDEPTLASWLSVDRPVGEVLVSRLLGISPPLAAHLALRVGIDPAQRASPSAPAALLTALRELAGIVSAGAFQPVWYEDRQGRPAAYAAIPLLTYASLSARPAESMSQAVVRVVEEEARGAAAAEQRQALEARLTAAVRRVEGATADVEAGLSAAAEAARWRRFGELLLAYGASVRPGADAVTVPDFDGTPVTIPIDPRRTPVANAQAYFRRHAKAALSRRALPERLTALRAERTYLEQLRVLVAQAVGPDEMRALAQEAAEAGLTGGRRQSRSPRAPTQPAPRVFVSPGGRRILVGRTGRENDFITFTQAAPDDLWFHARGMPGAHVVLKTNGRTPPAQEVESAAAVAAYFSQGRGSARVPVDVTARRQVRKPRGARPGMVTYREERTLQVAPGLPAPAEPAGGGTGRRKARG